MSYEIVLVDFAGMQDPNSGSARLLKTIEKLIPWVPQAFVDWSDYSQDDLPWFDVIAWSKWVPLMSARTSKLPACPCLFFESMDDAMMFYLTHQGKDRLEAPEGQ